VPRPGRSEVVTGEFRAVHDVNALGMNDTEVTAAQLAAKERVLVLGDSHTFAVGVSQGETWPARLERTLFGGDPARGTVWSAAVKGYGLGQYLQRFRQLRTTLRPTRVVVGFSMATDLYDLVPPGRGGFVYGGDQGRVYFDLDAQGALVERRELVGRRATAAVAPAVDPGLRLRLWLSDFALYRTAKQSNLALFLGTRVRPEGQSLWPGMDTALKIELSDEDRYRWTLAERILERLQREAAQIGAPLVVVDIPYLPQVYDEVWAASFGGLGPRYDRTIGNVRLAALCARIGAVLVPQRHRCVVPSLQRVLSRSASRPSDLTSRRSCASGGRAT
jgi:hypothetical protein